MKTYKINQSAHAGDYSVMIDGKLVAGKTSFYGGTIRHPRLYDTPEAATEAAAAMGGEAVLLV